MGREKRDRVIYLHPPNALPNLWLAFHGRAWQLLLLFYPSKYQHDDAKLGLAMLLRLPLIPESFPSWEGWHLKPQGQIKASVPKGPAGGTFLSPNPTPRSSSCVSGAVRLEGSWHRKCPLGSFSLGRAQNENERERRREMGWNERIRQAVVYFQGGLGPPAAIGGGEGSRPGSNQPCFTNHDGGAGGEACGTKRSGFVWPKK